MISKKIKTIYDISLADPESIDCLTLEGQVLLEPNRSIRKISDDPEIYYIKDYEFFNIIIGLNIAKSQILARDTLPALDTMIRFSIFSHQRVVPIEG